MDVEVAAAVDTDVDADACRDIYICIYTYIKYIYIYICTYISVDLDPYVNACTNVRMYGRTSTKPGGPRRSATWRPRPPPTPSQARSDWGGS